MATVDQKPQITILVPKKKDKFNYEPLEKLFLMKGIKSKTILPAQLTKWSNHDMFITIGDCKKFNAYTSQYEKYGLHIGFCQSGAWIYYTDSIIETKEDMQSFLAEYNTLSEEFGRKFKCPSEEEINDITINKIRQIILNKYNPIHWSFSLIDSIGKENRKDGESYFACVKRMGIKSQEIRGISTEHMYRFAVLKFAHDYLDDFMKENGYLIGTNDEVNNETVDVEDKSVKKNG